MDSPSLSSRYTPWRSAQEDAAAQDLARIFEQNPDDLGAKLENFPKYVRRQNLTRMLALYELFKRVLLVKGSILECGVNQGFGLMSWANFSAILEPNNLTRRVYGFDTFEGFPQVSIKDHGQLGAPEQGEFRALSAFDELRELSAVHDANRFLGHVPKIELVKGDATRTIPEFVGSHPHLLVSLLFLDFDLYEPTKVAIEAFLPRMSKGAIIAFDELDNPRWPGETNALLDTIGAGSLELQRLDWDPYITFAFIE